MKGYTGEGFLTRGHVLGGGRVPAPNEMRRLARANAEKRRVLTKSSGQRLGGTPLHRGTDTRQVIAAAAVQRAAINRGCASGTAQAGRLADQAAERTFKTKAEEDDANNRAIAEALFDLMEEEEARKLQGTFTSPPPSDGLVWNPQTGLDSVGTPTTSHENGLSEDEQLKWAMQESMRTSQPPQPQPQLFRNTTSKPSRHLSSVTNSRPRSHNNVIDLTEDDDVPVLAQTLPAKQSSPDSWTCEICTCINPLQFLTCDACGVERPASFAQAARTATAKRPVKSTPKSFSSIPSEQKSLGWHCRECASFMEHKWW